MIYMLFGQCDHSRLWMDGIGLCIGNPCVDPQFHQCWVHPWILYHFPACHSRPHLCSPQPVPISLGVSVLELWLFCLHKELGQPLTSDGRLRDSSGLPRLRQSEALTCCYSGRIQIKTSRKTGTGYRLRRTQVWTPALLPHGALLAEPSSPTVDESLTHRALLTRDTDQPHRHD